MEEKPKKEELMKEPAEPPRTPGSAEGDREMIEEDLKIQERKGNL